MFDPEKAINKILGLKGIIREKYNSRKLKQKVLYLHQPKVIDEEFDTELVELNVIVTKNDIKKYSNFSDAIIAAVKKKYSSTYSLLIPQTATEITLKGDKWKVTTLVNVLDKEKL